jgi:hypothetical protein
MKEEGSAFAALPSSFCYDVMSRRDLPLLDYGTAGKPARPTFTSFRRGKQVTSCAGDRTRGHCALSAMLTVSQLSKSFAGRALFDDVSLQVNRGDLIKFQS